VMCHHPRAGGLGVGANARRLARHVVGWFKLSQALYRAPNKEVPG